MNGRRRALAAVSMLPVAMSIAGCAGLSGRESQVWWEWADAGIGAPGSAAVPRAGSGGDSASARALAARAGAVLAVEGLAAGVVLDGTALLFSRRSGMLAPYQYAGWTERPAARLARLAQQRLRSRGSFRDVVPADAGVAPELLLTLTLNSLHHALEGADAADGNEAPVPGRLVLSVDARLVDWRSRRPVAGRRFEQSEPVTAAEAAAAVEAAGRAVARLLDSLAPWVEQTAAGALGA